MAGRTSGLIALALAGAADGPNAVHALAGRFAWHDEERSVGRLDDAAEVVPVDRDHAYVRVALEFPNGFSCDVSGIARAAGDALVYRAPRSACMLTLRHRGGELAFDDGGTCRSRCGANGTLEGGALPWRSRRPITYFARLRRSAEYRAGLREWRAR